MTVDRDQSARGPAGSFALVADAYERARPGYPEDAARWLAGTDPCDVVDLGAGTGKLTRSLIALGHRVTAVEPLPEMLAQLREAVPGVEAAVPGTAEAIPLPDASADVVTAAQAFHWFEVDAALPEIARVLRPSGVLALVWNARDDGAAWVGELSRAVRSETIEQSDFVPELDASELFGPVEQASFSFVQTLDRQRLRDLVLSRSYCAALSAEERAPVLAEVERIFDAHSENGEIELPYVTYCFRATRR